MSTKTNRVADRRQLRSELAGVTLASISTENLPLVIVNLMKLAPSKTEKDARKVYADALATADELSDRTGTDLTVVKNGINTSASMFFLPGTGAKYAVLVEKSLKDLGF